MSELKWEMTVVKKEMFIPEFANDTNRLLRIQACCAFRAGRQQGIRETGKVKEVEE